MDLTQDTALEQVALLIEQTPEFNSNPVAIRDALDAETQEYTVDESVYGEAPDEREARRLARQLLKRLEVCGWLDYEYREARKGYVLNFRDYAARVVHTLQQIAEQEQPIFEGLAHNVKASLHQAAIEEEPGAALYNAQKATKDLVREIKILSRNMHRYPERALKEAHTTQQLLDLQLNVYHEKVIDANYHRLKTSDNIFKFRGFILGQLDKFESGPDLAAAAKKWIARNESKGHDEAEAIFDDWKSLIRSHITSVHALVDELDRKNARYTATTLQKISYLLNHEHDIEGKLVRWIKELAEFPDSMAWAVDSPVSCFAVRFWDPQSLYVRPKEKAALELTEVPVAEADPERRRELMRRARHQMAGRFSRDRVYEIARARLKESGGMLRIADMRLQTIDDLVELIFLCCHGSDSRAPFELKKSDSWKSELLSIGPYRIHPGEFRWKHERGGLFNE